MGEAWAGSSRGIRTGILELFGSAEVGRFRATAPVGLGGLVALLEPLDLPVLLVLHLEVGVEGLVQRRASGWPGAWPCWPWLRGRRHGGRPT